MSTFEAATIRVSARGVMRAGAAIGGFAGALRIAAAFIPYAEEGAALEAFYAIIDLGLLFGTFAVYAQVAGRIGWMGTVGFAATAAGVASIVGPDGYAFGVDMWLVGVVVITAGLAVFSFELHRHCPEMRLPARLWGAYIVAFIWASLGMMGSVGGVVGGVLFGAGYVVAAIVLLTDADSGAREP